MKFGRHAIVLAASLHLASSIRVPFGIHGKYVLSVRGGSTGKFQFMFLKIAFQRWLRFQKFE